MGIEERTADSSNLAQVLTLATPIGLIGEEDASECGVALEEFIACLEDGKAGGEGEVGEEEEEME